MPESPESSVTRAAGSSPTTTRAAGAYVGRYRLLDEIGHGGMGRVFRAHDPELQREVAIKLLFGQAPANSELLARFYQEAQAAAALNHPNIVTIFDFGHDQGAPYLVMELLSGASSSTLAREAGAGWPLRARVEAAIGVCRGLACAHARGIVHRDIKPANVHIGIDGTPKILDFGVAHLTGSVLTTPMAVLGSPAYLAPEAVTGGHPDACSDVFSLGTTLYEWVTRQRAFPGESLSTVVWQIVHEEPPPAHSIVPECPEALGRAVARAMAKRPSERPGSAEAFAGELQQVLASWPDPCAAAATVGAVTASPPADPVAEPRPQSRRWRRSAGAVAAVGLMAMAVTAAIVRLRPDERTSPAPVATASRVASPLPPAGTGNDVTASAPAAAPPSAPERDAAGRVRPTGPSSRASRLASRPTERVPATTLSAPAAEETAIPVSAAPSTTTPAPLVVPVGTRLVVAILGTLRSDTARVGDRFEAALQSGVHAVGGVEIAGAGSRLRGRVERVGAEGGRPFLELSLTELRTGTSSLPLRTGNYRAVAPEPAAGPAFAAVVLGAAAGGVAGGLAAGKEGAVTGAGVGALAGASLGGGRSASSREYVLGERLTFKLAEPLQVAAR